MPKQKNDLEIEHSPVLVKEVLHHLDPRVGQSYLDLTAGYGGHASAVLDATAALAKSVLVDRDENAIISLKSEFKGLGVSIIWSDFLSTLKRLASEGRQFDMVLADLGVSSPHLEIAGRGFSFRQSGPLDMRMDQRQQLTAEQIVNHADESELSEILKRFGEEPRHQAIARAIVANRPIRDTYQLSELIKQTLGLRGRMAKIHPATRSFQAIRIAVNSEMDQLEQGLPLMVDVLAPGGRLVIISFHSLEDRLVKRFLADRAGNRYDAELRLLTKKPVTASPQEIATNPRARSAKLRAAAKIKTKIERK